MKIQVARLIDNSFDFHQKGAATAKEWRCRRGGSGSNRADSLNTGWVKVPVTFPALAVAAQLRIKMEWSLGDSNP